MKTSAWRLAGCVGTGLVFLGVAVWNGTLVDAGTVILTMCVVYLAVRR